MIFRMYGTSNSTMFFFLIIHYYYYYQINFSYSNLNQNHYPQLYLHFKAMHQYFQLLQVRTIFFLMAFFFFHYYNSQCSCIDQNIFHHFKNIHSIFLNNQIFYNCNHVQQPKQEEMREWMMKLEYFIIIFFHWHVQRFFLHPYLHLHSIFYISFTE